MPKKQANGRQGDRDTATVGSALDEVGFIPLGKRVLIGKREVRPTSKMHGDAHMREHLAGKGMQHCSRERSRGAKLTSGKSKSPDLEGEDR